MFVVVPDVIHEAITRKLDAAIADFPDAAVERKALYRELLTFFNMHGFLPEFTIIKKEEAS